MPEVVERLIGRFTLVRVVARIESGESEKASGNTSLSQQAAARVARHSRRGGGVKGERERERVASTKSNIGFCLVKNTDQ